MAASMRLGWPTLDQLADIRVPSIVVHGTEDRKLPIAHAEALGNGIAGAEILVRQGMGHLPRPADWDVIARELVAMAAGVSGARISRRWITPGVSEKREIPLRAG